MAFHGHFGARLGWIMDGHTAVEQVGSTNQSTELLLCRGARAGFLKEFAIQRDHLVAADDEIDEGGGSPTATSYAGGGRNGNDRFR